jgi:hypothetical protein
MSNGFIYVVVVDAHFIDKIEKKNILDPSACAYPPPPLPPVLLSHKKLLRYLLTARKYLITVIRCLIKLVIQYNNFYRRRLHLIRLIRYIIRIISILIVERVPGWLNELGSCRGPGWLNGLGSCRRPGWLNELGSCRGPGWLNELGSWITLQLILAYHQYGVGSRPDL